MKKDWEVAKLEKICSIEYGTRVVKSQVEKGNYSVYGGGGATFTINKYNRENRIVIARFAMSELCTRFVNGKFFLNDSGLTLSPINSSYLTQDYLNYLAVNFNDKFYTLGRGTAQKNLDVTALRNIEINYPKSISEQQRIVKILDEAFEKIEKAKEIAKKNLENSKEIFESYLTSVFIKQCSLSKPLDEVCKIIGGGTPSKTMGNLERYYNGNIPWATVGDMRNELLSQTEYKISNDAVKMSATNIIPKGNVIIATRVGLGKVCLLQQDTAINQDLKGIIPKSESQLLVKYLFWWFKSISNKIIQFGTGATVHGVKLPFIRSLILPLPSIMKQQEIVSKLDTISEQSKQLQQHYTQKLASLEELKKSILQKAFAGEL